MAAPYQYSLIGKFSHGYSTMTRLRAKFAALGLLKGFKIGVLVLKWTLDFDPNEESPIMPIWIKVLGLKPHWFHKQFLFHVSSIIGKPFKPDEATTEIENHAVARICVEINVIEKLQKEIPVQRTYHGSMLGAKKKNKENEDTTWNQDINVEQVWREKGNLWARLDKMRGKRSMGTPTLILPRGADLGVFIKENREKRGNNEAQDDTIMQGSDEDEQEINNYHESGKEDLWKDNLDQNSIERKRQRPAAEEVTDAGGGGWLGIRYFSGLLRVLDPRVDIGYGPNPDPIDLS
ncbi:hypothetical protein BUALT_Bualt02G0103000 [Buddleja alternifolia]|uniref:DUF4283 domain-containing protein n=1 Tax=Buddleja alternifolia TaxID=168488 RepID=A0AAV6Y3A0_9LAMI|nr:hypothetical protein BUALT_Bualt02G0103000 [Buddleja alternifolia]